MAKVLVLSLALVASCFEPTKFQTIVVTGTVTDTITGAPIPNAGVQVLFGTCFATCTLQGTPGTGPTDSLGHYAVSINGPSGSDCGGYQYFVEVDAGSHYTVGNSGFICGLLTPRVDFTLHPAMTYTINGTLTHLSGAGGIFDATVLVGLYPIGTSCLPTTSCVGTELTSTSSLPSGAYSFTFNWLFAPADCAGKEYLITVRAGDGFGGGEGRFPCGQLTTTLNLQLNP